MFALVVRFDVKQGCEEKFDALVARTINAIAHEPGTLVYLTSVPASETRVRVFLEVYRDEEAFDRHEQQPHVREFLTARNDLVDSVSVDRLIDVAGHLIEPGS
jgi:quinol monooxygenase YgiN